MSARLGNLCAHSGGHPRWSIAVSKKKDRAWFVCPQWGELVSQHYASVLIHSEDSQTLRDVQYWPVALGDMVHGAASMRGIECRRARAVGGHCGRPKSAAQTHRAGADCPRLGRSPAGAAGGKRIGISRPTVWRWQQRFAESGIDGLLRDRTRKPGKAPIAAETATRVVAMACTEPPHEATHWTGRGMAKAVGISRGSVQRIWQAHKLQPHRLRTFKRSSDPSFADKLTDVVGLYVDPPAHAVVLSIDEKSQIQALDRTQPGLPIKPGRCQTMTHDYKLHGTTTLFAALSVLDGTVIGRCMQRHRHLEFIRFLNAVERTVAADKRSMLSWTTTPPTSIPKCWPG